MRIADILDNPKLSLTIGERDLKDMIERHTRQRIHNLERRAGIWWARITGNDCQLSYRWVPVTDLLKQIA